eukprot:COSAG01_NODE_5484_length_4230_cov_12.160252_2_plen_133_part_00
MPSSRGLNPLPPFLTFRAVRFLLSHAVAVRWWWWWWRPAAEIAVTPDHRTRAGRQAVGPKGKGLPKEGNAIMLARATDGKVKLSTEVRESCGLPFLPCAALPPPVLCAAALLTHSAQCGSVTLRPAPAHPCA